MSFEKALWTASGVFAPDSPRQSSSAYTIQTLRQGRDELCEALVSAVKNEMPGYYSVYSFPRGHSRDGNIPKVDCIFIDLDVEGGDYDPNEGNTDFDAWRRDISALLARTRMIADAIIEADQEQHFRAVLSGHKGLHLYLDFPTIAPNNGTFKEFKAGLKEYGENVMRWLDNAAGGLGIEKWVDVDASDLGRLARHPNTIHHGAAYDDETRWCVPVTISELSELRVDDYLNLTTEPRWVGDNERTPSESAGKKAVQAIRNVEVVESSSNHSAPSNKTVNLEYESNENIDAKDVPFLTANYPCVAAFLERDDAFGHGNASHLMEVSVIGKMIELDVPRDVIHELFSQIPGYEKSTTDDQINTVIEQNYQSFNCNKIADRAPQFCHGSDCAVYRRNDDIQK